MTDEAYILDKKILTDQLVRHQWRVGSTVRDSLSYTNTIYADMIDEEVHRLEARILSEHLADDVYEESISYGLPSSTWQMFKLVHAAAWWMRWFVERWPVKKDLKTHTVAVQVGRYVNYPEAHVAVRDLGHPYIYEEMRRLAPWEVRQREEKKARQEKTQDDRRVEVFLLVEETVDDLAAATGLSSEWFLDALAYDRSFDLHSKVYVIPQEVHP